MRHARDAYIVAAMILLAAALPPAGAGAASGATPMNPDGGDSSVDLAAGATATAGRGVNPWHRLEWRQPVTVGRLVLRDVPGARDNSQGGKVLFSDGSALDVDDIPPDGKPLEVSFTPRRVKWLRIDLFSARGAGAALAGIEAYADAKPAAAPAVPATRAARYTCFDPNAGRWLDDRGRHIQGHMGNLLFHEGVYYWYGMDWSGKRMGGFPFDWYKNRGFAVYSSKDLYNWKYHANYMGPVDDPNSPLYDYTHLVARVKGIRARGTGRFVVLFQLVDEDFRSYNSICAAVGDRPDGPFAWHGPVRFESKAMQGTDIAVFTDDDGKQYLVGSAPQRFNVSEVIYELAGDCLSAVRSKNIGTGGEAPALFRHEGVYYLLHSHLSGLKPNDNFYHTARNIWGPWEARGRLAQGERSERTFGTQTMDVLAVPRKAGAFIYIGDSLRNSMHPETGWVWLPVTLKGGGEIEVRWRGRWDLSAFDAPAGRR